MVEESELKKFDRLDKNLLAQRFKDHKYIAVVAADPKMPRSAQFSVKLGEPGKGRDFLTIFVPAANISEKGFIDSFVGYQMFKRVEK